MINVMQSDFYRLRKGTAVRNTFFGVFATILVVAFVFFFMKTGAFQRFIEDAMQGQNVTQGDIISLQEDLDDMNNTLNVLPQNAASFGSSIIAENLFTIFLLPLVIVVVGADYSAGTYRNTLSFETNRKKVYIAKFLVSVLLTLLMLVASLVFSWLLGGILFGFGGFSGAYFVQILTTLLLQMPIYLALLAFAQCLVAVTQKSGAAIAIFLVVVLMYSSIVQLAAMLLPTFKWILTLDFLSAVKLAANYQVLPFSQILPSIIMGVGVLAVSFGVGLVRYVKSDMH